MPAPRPGSFIVGQSPKIHGELAGAGPAIVLCHGITATRSYVVHRSRALERAGYTVVSYDARGHGESDPAPRGEGYDYRALVDDLEAVIGEVVGEAPLVLVGHSMGSHTALAYAMRHPARVAAVAVIGPVFSGEITARSIAFWDGLAAALESSGVDGFVDYIGENQGIDSAWRETVLSFTRTRMMLHRHPEALVDALRQIPRSLPFEQLGSLEEVELPALVVASHDEADPGHPFHVAVAYSERLPRARLISEAEGESPLAWQGGRLSRAIAAFCAEPAVARRLLGG